MSTYAQNVREMLNNDGTTIDEVKKEVLLREYTRLVATKEDILKNLNDNYTKEKLQRVENVQKLIIARQKFLSDIAAVRGANDREALKQVQDDLQSIRELSTQLAMTNNPAVYAITQKAQAAGEQATTAGGEEGRKNGAAAAWSSLAGDLTNLGLVSEGNVYLPDIVRDMEREWGPISQFDPESQLGRKVNEIKRVAQASETQRVYARRLNLDQQLGKMAGIADQVLTAENLGGLMEDAKKVVNDTYANLDELGATNPEKTSASLDLMLAGSEPYQDIDKRIKELHDQLQGKASISDRQRIAKIMADPKFKEWAASNGWEIGESIEDPNNPGVYLYTPSKKDDEALRTYEYQMSHPGGGLIKDYNTREWVAVEVKGANRDASLRGSEYDASLRAAVGADPKTTLYAYQDDPDGGRTYLSGEQVDALLDAQRSIAGAPKKVYAVEVPIPNRADGAALPYLWDSATGSVYELATSSKGEQTWKKSAKSLRDIGFDEESIRTQGTPAVLTTPEGGSYLPNGADIEGRRFDTLRPAEPGEFEKVAGGFDKELLTKAGLQLSTEPPPTPTYTIYGKRIRQLATDPPGSIRVRSGAGEELIPAEEIVNVETTERGSRTKLRDALDQQLGRRDQARAAETMPSTSSLGEGVKKPNLADRLGALGNRGETPGEPGPRVAPVRIAGQEPVPDSFPGGTFMDTPDVEVPELTPLERASGMTQPNALDVLRSRQGLSDTGRKNELDATLEARQGEPASQLSETDKFPGSMGSQVRAPQDTTSATQQATDFGREQRERLTPKRGASVSAMLDQDLSRPNPEPTGRLRLDDTEIHATPSEPTEPATPAEPADVERPRIAPSVAPSQPSLDAGAKNAIERSRQGRSTLNERGEVVTSWKRERERVEAVSGGAATLNDKGEVIMRDGGPIRLPRYGSTLTAIPYSKFEATHPEKAAEPTVKPPVEPPAAPAGEKPQAQLNAPALTPPFAWATQLQQRKANPAQPYTPKALSRPV